MAKDFGLIDKVIEKRRRTPPPNLEREVCERHILE
jgi:hypothetical protein